ncbi:MAG: hypothetical protein JEZ08_06160 [Clostridiales bacterium]|nr:hypothetical protein [Clostridiales bacterium]
MKVTSYNMVQTSISAYHRQEMTTFKSEFIKVKRLNRELIDFDELLEADSEKDKNVAETKAKNELIESLMAYLDRREYSFREIPCIKPNDEKENVDASSATQETDFEQDIITTNRIIREHEVHETESMQFTSTGQITTEDDQIFEFSYDLEMNREFYNKNSSMIQQGMIDPLILNLDNKGIYFSDKKIHIDLDLDGTIDTFNMVNQGNGFLVLDKNSNGKIDDGSEMFGPQTDNGFEELKAYDQDNNHWIDENDVIFNNLKVWTLDEDGKETLIDIKEAGIGAIYLGKTDGKFDYKNGDSTIARITGSSIYLREDGSASAIHEIEV